MSNRGLLAAKLVKVMSSVSRVKKNGYNSFQNYAYVTESDILDAVKVELEKQNVMILSSVINTTREGDLTTVTVQYLIIDGDTGETIEVNSVGQGADKQDKGSAKAMTMASKYFLMKNFMIPTGDDPEATDENGKATGKKGLTAARPAAVKSVQAETTTATAAPVAATKKPGASFSRKSIAPAAPAKPAVVVDSGDDI